MNYRCAHRWAFSAFGGALAERTDELTAPTGREATVRVTHCGICHSDLHFVAGGFDLGQGQKTSIARAGATLPLTMGHEIAGELVELGPAAGDAPARIGEPVVVYPWIGCGACAACARGDDHLCTKVSRNLGLQLPGGYADLVRVPDARFLVPIGALEPARAATLACAGITAMGAIGKLGPIEPGQRVAVIGCGGVGMTAVALLKATTGAQVIAIDPDPAKRAAALTYGAASAHDPGEADVARTIQKAQAFDISSAIDFVASESSAALAVALVRRTGHVVFVGLFGGEFRMPLPMFALRSLRLSGSYVGSLADLRALVALAQRVDLPPTPLHLRPLAQVNEALADMAAGRFVGRTVLQP